MEGFTPPKCAQFCAHQHPLPVTVVGKQYRRHTFHRLDHTSALIRFTVDNSATHNWKADAGRLSDFSVARLLQFAQPTFQVHSCGPVVRAAARNQQLQRPVTAPFRGILPCRSSGWSFLHQYQPYFRPASVLHLRPILGRTPVAAALPRGVPIASASLSAKLGRFLGVKMKEAEPVLVWLSLSARTA